jgi:omega-amidase
MKLVCLSLKHKDSYEESLDYLVSNIKSCDNNSWIVVPELYISGYSYDNLQKAADFSQKIIDAVLEISYNKLIVITITTKKGSDFYNTLHIFKDGNIIHTQSKHKLFKLNDEQKYFTSGVKEDIKILDIDGIKVGCLICFEIRFTELWERLKGCDIIFVPAMWGAKRTQNFVSLTNALAIINQCYVVCCDLNRDDYTKSGGVITPFGDESRDINQEKISTPFDKTIIKKMRRYLPVGID